MLLVRISGYNLILALVAILLIVHLHFDKNYICYNMKHSILFIFTFSLLVLHACKSDKKSPEEPTTESTEQSEGVPERDNIRVDEQYVADDGLYNPRNPRWYTYRYDTEGMHAENPIVRANNNQEKSGFTNSDEVYDISETSRPPLFDKNCLTALNPEECSNEAVMDWMKYAVEKPTLSKPVNDVVHFVTFIVDEKGQVSDATIVPTRQQNACEPCKNATLEAVNGMTTWLPAVRNGKAVKVRIIFPVYYDES